MVLDATRARTTWDWAPTRTTEDVLDEILAHAREHPDWLDISES
jgi:nucleoside-diphosphate-sugar epimerase